MLKFKGLNVNKKKIEEFVVPLEEEENFILEDNIQTTFDSIYLIKKKKEKTIDIYSLENKNDKLHFLLMTHDELRILSACSNTNFLWLFGMSQDLKSFFVYKYSNRKLIEKIQITVTEKDKLNIDHLVIVSTDVNLYLFKNDDHGLQCLFQLNSTEKNEKKNQDERQLNESSTSTIISYEPLIRERVIQISAGKEHILFLTKSRNVYSFGLGIKGQLGHGTIENIYSPTLITHLKYIVQISTGKNGWHSGAINKEGTCYLWGWNSHGQLGIDANDKRAFILLPTKLELLNSNNEIVKFKRISCGSRHTALLDTNNNLYTFGWNKYKQLWQQQDDEENSSDNDDDDENYDVDEPRLVNCLTAVDDVKCGSWFTLIYSLH